VPDKRKESYLKEPGSGFNDLRLEATRNPAKTKIQFDFLFDMGKKP